MSPQAQAEAILAKADQLDEQILKLAQDREALLKACKRAAPMLEGAINLDIQTAQVVLERAIAQAEAK
jgi:hypothetical protein